jgi:hypothetical protein
MLLQPAPISLERFTYIHEENLLVTDASDLGRDFRLGRVYDDACDVGFTVRSHLTGFERVFSAGEKTVNDDEELYEEFTMVPESARKAREQGRSGDTRVRIYND